MKKSITSDQLILVTILLVLVITGVIAVIFLIGQKYKKNLALYNNPDIKTNVNLDDALDVSGITFKKKGQDGCINIAADGQVHIYRTCNEKIESVYRTYNNNSVNRLMDLVRSGKLSRTKTDGAYELIVHTDHGDLVYYFDDSDLYGDSNGDVEGEIIKIIDDIENDQPENTPTPTEAYNLPDLIVTHSSTPNPTIYYGNTPTPSIIPQAGEEDITFTCDYIDDPGRPKPFRVSNVVCSTEPEDPRR